MAPLLARHAVPLLLVGVVLGTVLFHFTLSDFGGLVYGGLGQNKDAPANDSPCKPHVESPQLHSQPLAYCQGAPIPGDFEKWFFNHTEGKIVWKWHHYFDIYEEILRRFRQRDHPVTMVEIGTRDGGSLEMWKQYFGPSSRIIGMDINPNARAFEDPRKNIAMHIGSQNDRYVPYSARNAQQNLTRFTRSFLRTVVDKIGAGKVQIVLDDASHVPEDQLTSFEELIPLMAPYSVYVVEDVLDGNSKLMKRHHRYPDEHSGATRPIL